MSLCILTPNLRLAAEEPDRPSGLDALLEGEGMVRIPAGEFLMGQADGNPDEDPAHRVKISHAFEIGKFEVTQSQWETVMTQAHTKTGAALVNSQGVEVSRNPSHFKGAALPVENVSWDDVELFLARLNQRDSRHKFRLPTEAEWEYAAKGRKAKKEASALDAKAWFKDNSGQRTQPIGQKEPNAFALYDMEGNVAEWVQDWYGREYYDESPLIDPPGPKTGSYRVYRGGSWLDESRNCRPSFRGFDFPVSRFYNVGFRVVRVPGSAAL